MYIEKHCWSKGLSRVVGKATQGLNSLLKAFWRALTFQTYRDCRKLVEEAVRIYGRMSRSFNTQDNIEHRVNYIVEMISDSENAVCWGVSCSHVARYMDKSFKQYNEEASSSYKLLWNLVYAVKHLPPELIHEVLNEALEHIESYEEAYNDRQAPPRPCDAPRDFGNGLGEEGTLP